MVEEAGRDKRGGDVLCGTHRSRNGNEVAGLSVCTARGMPFSRLFEGLFRLETEDCSSQDNVSNFGDSFQDPSVLQTVCTGLFEVRF